MQLSISELSVVGGWVGGGGGAQTHFMVGPGRGPTKTTLIEVILVRRSIEEKILYFWSKFSK